MIKKDLKIAIDGPVAAGKGTVAFLLAKKLGVAFIDSGTVTRMTALLCSQSFLEIDERNQSKICELVRSAVMEVLPGESLKVKNRVFLNGEDVTDKIRTPEVDWASSKISALPEVYRLITKKLQEIAKDKSLVMEGRNITTSVLPEADLKIFLTANVEERARRRFKEYQEVGRKVNFDFILEQIEKRDIQDMERRFDPLRITAEAIVLDATNLSIDEVVGEIMVIIEEKFYTNDVGGKDL